LPVHFLAPFAQSQPNSCTQTSADSCSDPSWILVLIGVLLVLAPILFFIVWRNRRRQLGHMGRGEVFSGIAQPGPQGLLTAPHGGGQCIWWREKAEEHPWTVKWENNAWKQAPGEYRWRENASYEPFLLVDATGTRQIAVHPVDAKVEGAERVVETTVKAPQPPPEQIGAGPGQINSGLLETEYEVFTLPAGKEVHILGAEPNAERTALYRPETEKAKMVISMESAPDYTARIESQRRWAFGSLMVSLFAGVPAGIALIVIASL
jgi:hypothetical protein